MKKITAILIALLMVAAMTACGGTGAENTSGQEDAAEPESVSEEAAEEETADQPSEEAASEESSEESVKAGYLFEVDGYAVAVDSNMQEVLDALGEPSSYFESESCAFQGMDKVYTYPSFVICTYPDGETDYVLSVELKDDLVETAEGICIGDTKDDVIEAYGDAGEETEVALMYEKDGCKLAFILSEDVVTSITYTSLAAS